jgi:hypothetical protein
LLLLPWLLLILGPRKTLLDGYLISFILVHLVCGLIRFGQSPLNREIGKLVHGRLLCGCLLHLAHFVVDPSLEANVLVNHLLAALWRSLLAHVSSLIHFKL